MCNNQWVRIFTKMFCHSQHLNANSLHFSSNQHHFSSPVRYLSRLVSWISFDLHMATPNTNDCPSWEFIYNVFMKDLKVRKWLFETKPPSITEIVYSLSNIPLFYGIQLGLTSDEKSSVLDFAGAIAIFEQLQNVIIGFSFSHQGFSLGCVGFEKILNATEYNGCPVNRCAFAQTKYNGRPAFITTKFEWLSDGAVLICTHLVSYDGVYPRYSVRSGRFHIRWFSAEQAATLLHEFESYTIQSQTQGLDIDQTKDSDHANNEKRPRTKIEFKIQSSKSLSIRPCSTAHICKTLLAPSTIKDIFQDHFNLFILPHQTLSLWDVYKSIFLHLNGHRVAMSVEVSRANSEGQINRTKYENINSEMNASTTYVMNSCLQQLIIALGIKTQSIYVDQVLSGLSDLSTFLTELKPKTQIEQQEKTTHTGKQQRPVEEEKSSRLSNSAMSRIWVCSICGVTIKGKRSNFLRHISNIHDDYRPFACRVAGCQRKFQNRSNLQRHISFVHGRTLFPCPLCTRVFKNERTFEEHKRSVHKNKVCVVRCDFCKGCFSKQSSLKRHLQSFHEKSDAGQSSGS